VITGSYSGTLQAGEGINIRIELPEGYFVGARPKDSMERTALAVIIAVTRRCLWCS
jgi:hypothetical protein